MLNLTPYILLAPLVGFVVLGLFGRILPRVVISVIGCGVVLVAFALALADFFSMLGVGAAHRGSDVVPWLWLTSGNLSINFGLLSDPLSAVMLLIVTGVGFLIHVYSIGYMEDDPSYWRFFCFLNFFVFAMCLLVAADNFLMLLVGWAGVGLASFLLIGFWYTRPSAVAAARKAFVVNVIGDFGLMIALFLMYGAYGTFAYSGVLHGRLIDTPTLTAITLMLFVAAAAKSAQLPLHVWLPDAMEGPTPVSALIHAATMVTAGVYLVLRLHAVYLQSPVALDVVALVGAVTAVFAAASALAEPDLKRVLAYSTISQLGYMFLGVGVGAFGAGFFHLTSHAFFKALLFLAAGAVMHALGGVTDMREMGGLGRILPRTAAAFGLGALALSGVPPLVGFVSKERILTDVYLQGARGLWVLGLLGSGLTAVYIVRAFALTFLGEPARPAAPRPAGNGDPPPVMAGPMWARGFLVLAGGLLGGAVVRWLEPVVGAGALRVARSGAPEGTLVAAGVAVALAGIALAWLAYARQRVPLEIPKLGAVLSHQFFVEQAYAAVVVEPARALARWAAEADRRVIDGAVVGLGRLLWSGGAVLRRAQTGYLRHYAALLLVGALLILAYWVWR